MQATSTAATSFYRTRYQLVSFFGRVNYTFMNRYLLTATVRRDGTSRFGKNHRWGTSPLWHLGWKILDESFMEGARGVLNDLKLRVDYGVTGQQSYRRRLLPLPAYLQHSHRRGQHIPHQRQLRTDRVPPKSTTPTSSGKKPPLGTSVLTSRSSTTVSTVASSTISVRPPDLLVWANYPAGSNLSNMGKHQPRRPQEHRF